MKKVLLSAFAVFAFVAATNAQDFGVKVGTNFANVGGDDVEDTDSKFNFTFGLFGEFMLSDKIGLQPELEFSGQGFKYDVEDGGVTVEYKQKLGYINIPVLANVYLGENFFIQAGPYLGILTSAKQSVSGTLSLTDEDNKDDFQSTDFGAKVGIGANAGKFNFGVRYQLGLSDIVEDASVKNRVLQFAVGFKILDN